MYIEYSIMSKPNHHLADAPTEFVENIKKWVLADTQLKLIHDKTKLIRENKQELLDKIINHVSANNMESKRIEISDGELRFYEKKEYSPLTFTYVEECLGKIISDKKQVEYIINYLKENRQIKTCSDIRRNYKTRSSSFS